MPKEITLEWLADQIDSLNKRFDRFTATYLGFTELYERLAVLELCKEEMEAGMERSRESTRKLMARYGDEIRALQDRTIG